MVRITHPFHPCHDEQFELVTIRQNWGEDQVYYRDAQGRLVRISASWTDLATPDPVVALSAGRSPFRLEDLMELTRLVAALSQEGPHER